jgi:hypothetical protein
MFAGSVNITKKVTRPYITPTSSRVLARPVDIIKRRPDLVKRCNICNTREHYANAPRPYIKPTRPGVLARQVDIIQRRPDLIKPTQRGR